MNIPRLSTIALPALCTIALLAGQAQLKFETASVKRTARGAVSNSLDPAMVILKGDPLNVVIAEAFGVKTYEIVGPAWLDEDCFEIIAKMPEGGTREQIPAMLQTLLAERFRLAAHREQRPRPVYAMVVDRSGPKFKQTNPEAGSRPGQVRFLAGADAKGVEGAMTMARLAHFLSVGLDRPVRDFTGLKGTYDIDLSWAPEPGIDRPATNPFTTAGADTSAAPRANLFTSIRDRLGLKLEARNEPVEMLVIDHVERVPNEN